MNNISSKKMYFYISLSLVFIYFTVVLFAYNAQTFKELYTLEYCSLYYVFGYILLSAIAYIIDIGSRKEPGFLTLMCLPVYSFVFLLGMMMLAGVYWTYMVLLLIIFGLFLLLGIYCYKHWIHKILFIKNGYDNILFLYVLIHLFIVLFIAFKMLNLL